MTAGHDFGDPGRHAPVLAPSIPGMPQVDINRLTRWQERRQSVRPSKRVIGFSQATTVEPWRVQFNVDIAEAAAKLEHRGLELLARDGNDDAEKQIADIEYFIACRVDAILISPKEAARLTKIALKAINLGIPVFVLDRNLNTEKYTSFIRGDNEDIGRKAGEHAAKLLSSFRTTRDLNILEIWGGLGTEASRDRNKGFCEGLEKAATKLNIKQRIQAASSDHYSADWKQIIAYELMIKALRRSVKIDIVYCHNDAMAYGAYLAASECGRAQEMKFIGVDGLSSQGIEWVRNGLLAATFKYPTPGAEGLRQAISWLDNKTANKEVIISCGDAITKKSLISSGVY